MLSIQVQKEMMHKLLIVGAGFGGNGVITGLTQAAQKMGDGSSTPTALFPEDLEVTMLDRKTSFSISAAWQFAWSSRLKSPTLEWPITDLKANHFENVKFISGEDEASVETLLVEENRVLLKNGKSIEYDTLVISAGVISDPTGIPGLVSGDGPVDYSNQALDICNGKHISLIQQGIDQVMEDAKTSPKTILVCVTRMPYKCPPVPFEVASILDDLRRERGVLDNVKILLSVPVPFPFAGPPAEKLFRELLAEQNIEYLPNHVVTKITDGTTFHFEVGEEEKTISVIKADLVLATYPQRAPDFCKPLCKNGYIPVDLVSNKVNSHSNIYAIGDACHAMFPKPNKPHPKAGEFAYMMGLHVADQIVAKLKSPESTVAPPTRVAACVAECGSAGKGVLIQPNFSEILASPAEGMPKFDFPLVDDAAGDKMSWINGYLTKFFAEGKVAPFGG